MTIHTQLEPAPVSPGLDYYAQRALDYTIRHPHANGAGAVTYYLDYGQRYCDRFNRQLRPRLSLAGQVWVRQTCLLLQLAIEQTRAENPAAFARLEEDADAFHTWVYATHAKAYIQGGIADLPLRDLLLIVATIDCDDLVTAAALPEIVMVLHHLACNTTMYRLIRCFLEWLQARIQTAQCHPM